MGGNVTTFLGSVINTVLTGPSGGALQVVTTEPSQNCAPIPALNIIDSLQETCGFVPSNLTALPNSTLQFALKCTGIFCSTMSLFYSNVSESNPDQECAQGSMQQLFHQCADQHAGENIGFLTGIWAGAAGIVGLAAALGYYARTRRQQRAARALETADELTLPFVQNNSEEAPQTATPLLNQAAAPSQRDAAATAINVKGPGIELATIAPTGKGNA